MYPVTDKFLTEVRDSHVSAVKVEIYDISNGKIIATPNPIGGSVVIDNRRQVRRTFSLDLVDVDGTLIPTDPKSDILGLFNREIRIYRGVTYANGTQELVPLGVFSIDEVSISDAADGVKISIAGNDRSLRVSNAKFTDHSFYIASGTAKETAIKNILLSRYPKVITQFPATGQVTADIYPSVDQSSDPWKEATNIASSAGMDLFFDATGICRLKPIVGGSMQNGIWIPSINIGLSVATYTDGSDSVLTQLSRKLSSQDSFNGVIYTGEGTNLTIGVIGTAWDDNPSSPTYRQTYGEKPKYMSSPTILTTNEATFAAQAELLKVIGATEELSWNQIVNPAHDVYDIVTITRPASGVKNAFIIDALTIPLDPSSTMSAVGRNRRF